MTENSPAQAIERYADCPTEQNEYDLNGRKYTVTRHFTGEKNINLLVAELAVARANRETVLGG